MLFKTPIIKAQELGLNFFLLLNSYKKTKRQTYPCTPYECVWRDWICSSTHCELWRKLGVDTFTRQLL